MWQQTCLVASRASWLTWFLDGKKLDIDEVEDILSQIMTDEFNATLEDDSPYLVAKHLVLLFNQCINGNYEELERLREKAKTQNTFVASTCVKQGDDSDDEDEGDDSQDTNNDHSNVRWGPWWWRW